MALCLNKQERRFVCVVRTDAVKIRVEESWAQDWTDQAIASLLLSKHQFRITLSTG
jgi:hypothetical protein